MKRGCIISKSWSFNQQLARVLNLLLTGMIPRAPVDGRVSHLKHIGQFRLAQLAQQVHWKPSSPTHHSCTPRWRNKCRIHHHRYKCPKLNIVIQFNTKGSFTFTYFYQFFDILLWGLLDMVGFINRPDSLWNRNAHAARPIFLTSTRVGLSLQANHNHSAIN